MRAIVFGLLFLAAGNGLSALGAPCAGPIHVEYTSNDSPLEMKSDQPWGQTFSHVSGDGTYTISAVGLLLNRLDDTESQNITVSLREDWGGPVLGSEDISTDDLDTTESWVYLNIGDVQLDDGVTYYLHVVSSEDFGKVYVAHDSGGTYPDGDLINKDGVPESGKDMSFRLKECLAATYTAQIVSMERTETVITLWSVGTNDWPVQPQYCADLSDDPQQWLPITPFTNELQVSTNVTSFDNPVPRAPTLCFRIEQTCP